MYKYFNPNPRNSRVGDCAVRAVAKATNRTWKEAYIELCVNGFNFGDMPSSNNVWGEYLKRNGFKRCAVPNECPNCYTITDFAKEHPKGIYVVALHNHVVTVVDGDWFDTWDSGNEVPLYYWHYE